MARGEIGCSEMFWFNVNTRYRRDAVDTGIVWSRLARNTLTCLWENTVWSGVGNSITDFLSTPVEKIMSDNVNF